MLCMLKMPISIKSVDAVCLGIIIVAVLTAPGCNKSSNPASLAQSIAEKNSADENAAVKRTEQITAIKSDVEKPVSDESAGPLAMQASSSDQVNSDQVNSVEASSVTTFPLPSYEEMKEQADAGKWTWRRYVLLADSGPILLDFQIAIGGQCLAKQVEDNKNRVIAGLIPDSLESTTWAQVVDSPRLSQSVFSNLRPTDDQQKKDIIKRYDIDGNGHPSVNELYSYLSRGISGRNVVIFDEANRFRSENSDQSSVFVQMDADQDGILDDGELAQCSVRLAKLDLNGDFIVSGSEVRPPEMDPQAFMRQRNQNVDDAFIFMNPEDERATATSVLRRYSFSNAIVLDDWPQRADLFGLLDSDQDGELVARELRRIIAAPSDMVFQLAMPEIHSSDATLENASQQSTDDAEKKRGENDGEKAAASKVRFRYHARMLNQWSTVLGNQVIDLPNVRFRAQLLDTLDQENLRIRTEQQASQLGITPTHSRDVEDMSGAIQNQATLAGLDFDDDKKVTYEEIEKAVSWKAQLTEPFVRIRAVDPPDAWFVWLDANWDDLLSEQEIANAPRRIAQVRKSDETTLSASLLPMQLQLVFTRTFGDEQAFQRLTPSTPDQPNPNASALDWFQAMDANMDGNVTLREFLGDISSFEALDINHDRILTANEIGSGISGTGVQQADQRD